MRQEIAGMKKGSELCNGYLYAKDNELKSAGNCDDEADDPEMNISEEFLQGCRSSF